MREHQVKWPARLDAGASALVPCMVAAKRAVGPCPAFRRLIEHQALRVIPLPGKPRVKIGLLCCGAPQGLLARTVEFLAEHAQKRTKENLGLYPPGAT
jgi:hypothetical protein